MSTRIREFRTIKCAEFYPNSHFILDPSLVKFSKNESIVKQPSVADLPIRKMHEFLEKHKEKFNES